MYVDQPKPTGSVSTHKHAVSMAIFPGKPASAGPFLDSLASNRTFPDNWRGILPAGCPLCPLTKSFKTHTETQQHLTAQRQSTSFFLDVPTKSQGKGPLETAGCPRPGPQNNKMQSGRMTSPPVPPPSDLDCIAKFKCTMQIRFKDRLFILTTV